MQFDFTILVELAQHFVSRYPKRWVGTVSCDSCERFASNTHFVKVSTSLFRNRPL